MTSILPSRTYSIALAPPIIQNAHSHFGWSSVIPHPHSNTAVAKITMHGPLYACIGGEISFVPEHNCGFMWPLTYHDQDQGPAPYVPAHWDSMPTTHPPIPWQGPQTAVQIKVKTSTGIHRSAPTLARARTHRFPHPGSHLDGAEATTFRSWDAVDY